MSSRLTEHSFCLHDDPNIHSVVILIQAFILISWWSKHLFWLHDHPNIYSIVMMIQTFILSSWWPDHLFCRHVIQTFILTSWWSEHSFWLHDDPNIHSVVMMTRTFILSSWPHHVVTADPNIMLQCCFTLPGGGCHSMCYNAAVGDGRNRGWTFPEFFGTLRPFSEMFDAITYHYCDYHSFIINRSYHRVVNAFTSVLAAPSLKRRPLEVSGLKRLMLSPLFACTLKKTAQHWKYNCYRPIKYAVCRRVYVQFSAGNFTSWGT